jgi:hypothetical protein
MTSGSAGAIHKQITVMITVIKQNKDPKNRYLPATDAASPMPGNTYMLLHCEGVKVRPSVVLCCRTQEY